VESLAPTESHVWLAKSERALAPLRSF
jgi:hypothetical protein